MRLQASAQEALALVKPTITTQAAPPCSAAATQAARGSAQRLVRLRGGFRPRDKSRHESMAVFETKGSILTHLTGGFGTNNASSGFGSKPAFGASTSGSGGLFGSSNTNTANNTSSGFGGFGGTSNTTSGFGSGTNTSASGGLFGANKTGFGTSTSNTGNSLFGGGGTSSTTTGGFGSGGGFGTTNNAAVGDPPGTAVTPFQAYSEKETNSAQTNSFQNLLFQDPYKKWSAEELRLVDYAQGRRHGNASGAGAFGVSSGFGGSGFGSNTQQTGNTGFGSTATNNNTGGLFGSNTNTNNTTTNTGFGQAATTTGGFGSTTSGSSLFGANKPAATGGLFGGNTQTQQSGGLFGSGNTNTATTGGFGNTGATGGFGSSNTAAGGLFGSSAQNKPQGTGFSFGNTGANTTNTSTGFGTSNSTGFGTNNNANTASGGLFGGGNANTAQSTGGGLFGGGANNNTQQTTTSGFGGFGGQQNQTQQSGGLFGNNASQQKPAGGGLFGSSTTTGATGGGLFGSGNTQQNSTSGFGATNSTAGSGGLFGNKPATGGLFGSTNTAQTNTTGGSLFGNSMGANTQQNTGGGLFGSTNAQQQKPGGLFGNSTQSSGGLFGSQNSQNTGSSLFGGQQQNQQGGGLGGSLLGASQQSQNAPQGLTANLNDVSAYGTPALFAGLGGNEISDPGPLATPLNGSSKPRKSNILPLYKLAPASASRYATPQKRGFGFSYSSYGTPGGSPASISSTPGGGSLGRSLLGSSSSGSLAKSMSTNNLRRAYNTEDSILAPGAFSSSNGARWYGSTGSKKLVINREIRSDLFSTPQKDKQGADSNSARKLAKRVSFDTSNVEDETTPVRAALPAPGDSGSPLADETPRQPKPTPAVASKSPEAEQVKGNELAIVREEENAANNAVQSGNGFDNAPGDYWMTPSRDEIQSMNRVQRQKIDGFTVGRDNVGSISFKIPVDISSIDLDDLCGGIIQLEPRSATVYPVSAKKPPVGKGLNVPARISLEQSWPRGGRDKRVTSDPKRFNKHIDRLKRIPDTTFESYDKDTGIWTFSVEHFTTYGLDDSDEETDADIDMETTKSPELPRPTSQLEAIVNSPFGSEAYAFKKRRGLPGAFDMQEEMYEEPIPQQGSFLGVSSADSVPNEVQLSLEGQDAPFDMGEEYEMSDDEDLTRSSLGQHHAAELDEVSSEDDDQDTKRGTPGGILRARMRAVKGSAGPVSLEVADGDDWAEMLRKTVSPVKRDRHVLRELNESPSKGLGSLVLHDDANEDLGRSAWGKSVATKGKNDGFGASRAGADKGRGFATSIDLMNSLFEKPKPNRENLRASVSKGFPKVGTVTA